MLAHSAIGFYAVTYDEFSCHFAKVSGGFICCAVNFAFVFDGKNHVPQRNYPRTPRDNTLGNNRVIRFYLVQGNYALKVCVCALVRAENHPSFHRLQRLNQHESFLDNFGRFAPDAEKNWVRSSRRDDDSALLQIHVVESVWS